ncbi:MAG: MFS transporter, partial [Proteobacteria bacterium]|nr:MFS transporter [Burkholderiales bacterium]
MTSAFAGPCDAGVAGSIRAGAPGPTDAPGVAPHERSDTQSIDANATPFPRATLAATILGSSVAFIDGSVMNVALPALAQDLGAGPEGLSWVINAYLLPLGALMLLGGGSGDHYGRRRLFLLGLAIFTLASLVCATAPTLAWLLGGRVLQGLGAALLMPNSLGLLGAAFSGEARGR